MLRSLARCKLAQCTGLLDTWNTWNIEVDSEWWPAWNHKMLCLQSAHNVPETCLKLPTWSSWLQALALKQGATQISKSLLLEDLPEDEPVVHQEDKQSKPRCGGFCDVASHSMQWHMASGTVHLCLMRSRRSRQLGC